MGNLAISVRDLGKQYRIGGRQERHETFMAALTAAMVFTVKTTAADRDSLCLKSRFFGPLRNISFELDRGEVLGIIGRNGAGKIHDAQIAVAIH
jgi:lipopolysaccharide transport system ATP-binding protein